MLHIGFTGTRHGMTEAQRQALGAFLDSPWFWGDTWNAHHGVCLGADVEFEDVVSRFANVRIVTRHPGPEGEHAGDPHARHSRMQSVVVCDRQKHMRRNRTIVEESNIMLAAPFDMHEHVVGGTWKTIIMARSKRKPLAIVWPDGTVTKERWP
jgi:hypothetical protein